MKRILQRAEEVWSPPVHLLPTEKTAGNFIRSVARKYQRHFNQSNSI